MIPPSFFELPPRGRHFFLLPSFCHDYIYLKNDLFAEQEGLNIFGRDALTLNQDLANLGMASFVHIVPLGASVYSAQVGSTTAAVPESSQVAASLLLVAGIAGFVIVKRRKEASELEALTA